MNPPGYHFYVIIRPTLQPVLYSDGHSTHYSLLHASFFYDTTAPYSLHSELDLTDKRRVPG